MIWNRFEVGKMGNMKILTLTIATLRWLESEHRQSGRSYGAFLECSSYKKRSMDIYTVSCEELLWNKLLKTLILADRKIEGCQTALTLLQTTHISSWCSLKAVVSFCWLKCSATMKKLSWNDMRNMTKFKMWSQSNWASAGCTGKTSQMCCAQASCRISVCHPFSLSLHLLVHKQNF